MTYTKTVKEAVTLFCILMMCVSLTAQFSISDQISAQRSALEQLQKQEIFQKIAPNSIQRNNVQLEGLKDYTLLDIERTQLNKIIKSSDEVMKINLPLANKNLTVNLVEADIFGPSFKVTAASNRDKEIPYNNTAHYWGEIEGMQNSLVSLSFFKGEVAGVLTFGGQTYNLGKIEGQDLHVLYKAADLENAPVATCHTDDVLHMKGDGFPTNVHTHTHRMDESNCVGIYIECAYDMFVDEGSIGAVTDYVTAVFTEVAALYTNEAINVYISEILVWDVNDPYSESNFLNDFRNTLNANGGFNGDLAHLLSYNGSGGVAYLDVLCVPSFAYGFSGINPTYNNVPTYSWTIEVFTHELGHNLGSPHTHACSWNGNNTAIDGCGPAAGYSEGCDAALPDAGTIMSYCHLVGGVGIDFNLGFGDQPGDLIRDEVYNASCLTSCVDCDTVGDPCDDGDPCTIGDEINALCECEGTYTDADGDGLCVANDPDDNDPCVPVECPPCSDVTVTINLDNYPEETTWDIVDASGNVVASGGPYGNQPDGSTVTTTVCLEDGCYDFTIYDSYGDGICCGYGIGDYVVTDANGNTLASGGQFGSSETTNFCLDSAPCEDEGLACDDGDACTTGETYDVNCNCTGGVFQDADGDGVCDAEDQCPGTDDALIGTACDDGDACTTGEAYDTNCNCSGGVFQDADGDGVCDAEDQCPGTDDALIGTACDDGDACTTGETYDANCNCSGGVFQDADGDGVCDAEDQCPGTDDGIIGAACDDGDDCTTGEIYDENCGCSGGVYTDADGDGFCVGDDPDDNNPCIPVECPCEDEGMPCDDGDACTVGETYDAECNCVGGVFQDTDGDGVCDAEDQCPGTDDGIIGTACDDGDACTTGETFDANCACSGGVFQDADGDGVCDAEDQCPDFDDNLIGTACDDGDACTVGETYDVNCGCSGGIYTDEDGDGFCVGEDPNDNDPCVPDDSDPDCGGGSDCTEVSSSDFETGWQGWVDGGSDADVGTYTAYAYSGTECLRLRDNNSTSTASSPVYDFSSATSLVVDFTYVAVSMDNNNEDFWLQVSTNGGASYVTVEEWNLNDEFVNGVREFANVTINGPFSSNTRLRFRCDASGNSDWVYIDDIVIESCDDGSGGNPTCDDGLQNGDEEGIDCGGTNCPPCEVGCNLENLENFESGWGIWNDGGSDARRSINDAQYAYSGSYCIRLRDDSSTSITSTDDLDLNAADEVNITFTYITVSMDNANEDFFLEVSTDGGVSYSFVEEWNLGDEFQNNVREFDSVNIPGPFTSTTRFRFRCDASTNGDRVYLDDIEIESCSTEGLVEPVTASSIVEDNLEVNVYPNPLEPGNLLNVNILSSDENVVLSMMDMYGKLLFQDQVSNKDFGRYKLNTSNMTVGSYLLRIDSEKDYKLQKIVIMR